MTLTFAQAPIARLLLGLAALAVLGLLDCTLMQLMRSGFEVDRTLWWTAGTLAPLAGAAALVATYWHRPTKSGRAVLQLGAAAIALLALLVVSDLLIIPPDGTTEWLERARSKAPGVVAFMTLGALAPFRGAFRREQRLDRDLAELAPGDRTALAQARLVNAAGNYIEVYGPDGCARLIRIPLGRVAEVGDRIGLVRLHRSALVRACAIRRWRNDRTGLVAVELEDGTLVPVSRKYRGAAYALRNACTSSQDS